MYTYPKKYLTPSELIANLKTKGMTITSSADAENIIKQIGYYRLKGYFFDLFDSSVGRYIPGTSFDNIIELYHFDIKLSRLIFDYLLRVEVSLRARLIEALQIYDEPLVLNDPSVFSEKKLYWENTGTVSSEIARSSEEFIRHNFKKYNGTIPVWAAVEVMQYGTLSKVLKNLVTGPGSAMDKLLDHYKYPNADGIWVKPSKDMFSSWTQATNTMRNICAHNGRIYNRSISTLPKLIASDALPVTVSGTRYGVYHQILAMKYLKPDDSAWTEFVNLLKSLLTTYSTVVDFSKLFFPPDWEKHIV